MTSRWPACAWHSTTVSSYQAVTPDGRFQFGHSKGANSRLPILKVMAATLDPLQLPLVTTVLPGHHADDPLYVPAMHAVRQGLRQSGVLYCGDSKMGALDTRAFVARGQDFYLCPLGEKQLSVAALDALLFPVWAGDQSLTAVHRPQPGQPPSASRPGLRCRRPWSSAPARTLARGPNGASSSARNSGRSKPAGACTSGWRKRAKRSRTWGSAVPASGVFPTCRPCNKPSPNWSPGIKSPGCCHSTIRKSSGRGRSGGAVRTRSERSWKVPWASR
jgi:hypothetical protein